MGVVRCDDTVWGRRSKCVTQGGCTKKVVLVECLCVKEVGISKK